MLITLTRNRQPRATPQQQGKGIRTPPTRRAGASTRLSIPKNVPSIAIPPRSPLSQRNGSSSYILLVIQDFRYQLSLDCLLALPPSVVAGRLGSSCPARAQWRPSISVPRMSKLSRSSANALTTSATASQPSRTVYGITANTKVSFHRGTCPLFRLRSLLPRPLYLPLGSFFPQQANSLLFPPNKRLPLYHLKNGTILPKIPHGIPLR